MAAEKQNTMKSLKIEKITVNICVGNDKAGMVKAEKLIKKLTNNRAPVKNCAKMRLATWSIRPGLPIGYKVTLRGEEATKFLAWILDAKGKTIRASSIDRNGNFSLGMKEYLDLAGMKYDAEIGMMGFECMVTFIRPGFRVKSRLIKPAKVPARHRLTKEEVLNFMTENFGVKVN